MGVVLNLVSCGENSKKEKETITVNQESNIQSQNIQDVDTSSTAEFKDEQTAKMYKDYIQIKSAFVASDASKASKAAEKLLSDLNEDADKDLKDAAQKIAQRNDINKQREAFLILPRRWVKNSRSVKFRRGVQIVLPNGISGKRRLLVFKFQRN